MIDAMNSLRAPIRSRLAAHDTANDKNARLSINATAQYANPATPANVGIKLTGTSAIAYSTICRPVT